MADKLINKYTNNFLQKFIMNTSKPDMESKIENNNGYTVENTDNTSNNLLSLLNYNLKSTEPLFLPKSNIMNHLEKRLNRKENIKLKTANVSTNISKEKIKNIVQKNAFSPKFVSHQITRSNVPVSETKDSNTRLIILDKCEEKIVLKSSSKLTFSPNFSVKKIPIISPSLYKNQNQTVTKKKNTAENTKNTTLLNTSKKPTKEESSKVLTQPNIPQNKKDILLESRKQFNKNFTIIKQKDHNETSNHIPPSPNSTGYQIDEECKRSKSENKKQVKTPTKLTLFNPKNVKSKANKLINTTYNSSSPTKNKDPLHSAQNSLILSSENRSNLQIYSEILSNNSNKNGEELKVSKLEIEEDSVATHNLNINYNYIENTKEEQIYISKGNKSIVNKNYIHDNFIKHENKENSNKALKECFIKNRYKHLLDNYNKNNFTSNVI